MMQCSKYSIWGKGLKLTEALIEVYVWIDSVTEVLAIVCLLQKVYTYSQEYKLSTISFSGNT